MIMCRRKLLVFVSYAVFGVTPLLHRIPTRTASWRSDRNEITSMRIIHDDLCSDSSPTFVPMDSLLKELVNSHDGTANDKDTMPAIVTYTGQPQKPPTGFLKNPFAGVDFNPELIAILAVYFVQGALGLSRLAISFFMKDDLHLSPAEVSAFVGISTLPWIIKPLYGFFSDGFPLFNYRRRSYLALAGLAGALSWLALGTVVNDAPSLVVATVIGSMSVAICDVVADSIVVERSRDAVKNSEIAEETARKLQLKNGGSADVAPIKVQVAGELQSLCWGAAAVGGIISAYFSGSLLQTMTPRFVFEVTALFPLLVAAVSFFIEEEPTAQTSISDFKESVGQQLVQLKETMSNPAIYLPVAFVCLWQATPTPESAMFYFFTNELGFQPEFLGQLSFASSIATLAGVAAYRNFLKNVSIKKLIFWSTVISAPLSLSQLLLVTHVNRQLGIPDKLFALTDDVVVSVLAQVAFMPTLVLASTLCPAGVEATVFSTLMSLYNAAHSISSELGAGLTSLLGVTETNNDNLFQLVLISGLSSMIALPFIGLLDKNPDTASATGESVDVL